MTMLSHIAIRVLGTPLMIERGKLEVILSVLGPRIGVTSQGAVSPSFTTEQAGRSVDVTPEGIAVIPVLGTLVKRVGPIEAASGLTSYAEIEAELEATIANPAVKAILLDIDSPGGEVAGVFDLADRIHAAREAKPIWAVANEEALSGAYAIASAAERVFVPRTGAVGSIGVIAVHVDRSTRDAQEGLAYTTMFAGQRKNDFSPHEPLSDEARSVLQAEVDRVYDLFAAIVARNRGLSVDAVKATDAGLFFSENAVRAGLADGVGNFSEALAALREEIASPAMVSANVLPIPVITNHQSRKELSMSEDAEKPAAVNSPPATESHESGGDADSGEAAPQPTLVSARAKTPEGQSEPQGPSAEVIDLEQVRAEGYREAAAIAELCALAGMPERSSDMIARGLSAEQARRELLEARASEAGPEIHSHVSPMSQVIAADDLESNPVVRAAKARATAKLEA